MKKGSGKTPYFFTSLPLAIAQAVSVCAQVNAACTRRFSVHRLLCGKKILRVAIDNDSLCMCTYSGPNSQIPAFEQHIREGLLPWIVREIAKE